MQVSFYTQVCAIPPEVVADVQKHGREKQLVTRSKVFNELSAHLYSDHRAMWVDLCVCGAR